MFDNKLVLLFFILKFGSILAAALIAMGYASNGHKRAAKRFRELLKPYEGVLTEKGFNLNKLSISECSELLRMIDMGEIKTDNCRNVFHIIDRQKARLEFGRSEFISAFSIINLSGRATLIAIVICTTVFLSSFLVKPYVQPELESMKNRYGTIDQKEELSAKIINKDYHTGIFGGQYYKLVLELPKPVNEEYEIEVDPVLFNAKRVNDTLKVFYQFRGIKDKHTGELLSTNVYSMKILER